MRARRLHAVLAASLCVASLLASAPAHAAEDEYFLVKAASESTIYRVAGSPDSWDDTRAPRVPLSYSEWAALGHPAPIVRPVDTYAHLPWSPGIYGLVHWPDGGAADAPVNYEQWVAAGRPAPVADARLCELVTCSVIRYATSPAIYVAEYDHDVPHHHLTGAEWAAMGYPPPMPDSLHGIYRLPWTDGIFRIEPWLIGPAGGWSPEYPSGVGWHCWAHLEYAEWLDLGSPAPETVASTTRDRYLSGTYNGFSNRSMWESKIYYDGPAGYFQLTPAQWAAAGSPTPTRIDTPMPEYPGC